MAARRASPPYLRAWLALLGLAAISLFLSRLHLGATFMAVALVVAGAQATVAALVFMDLGEARFSVALVPLVVLAYVALLCGLMATDVASRRTFPQAPAPHGPEEP